MHTRVLLTIRRKLLAHLGAAALLAGSLGPVHAGPQRNWQIHEFTRVELVAREAGAAPNQHPARLTPETLREQLSQVRFAKGSDRLPLFAVDELAELVGPLSQALENAGPGDDVLLLSSSRREGGLIGSPTAITARLFVQDGALQLIVRDARFDFYNLYRGTQTQPRFSYGTRSATSATVLDSAGANQRRADWLALSAVAATAPVAAAATAPVAAPAAAATPAPVTPAAPEKKSQDIEQRLETLKRLREKNLITEDEYQQKRKELLQQL